jgi:hypothetical protein
MAHTMPSKLAGLLARLRERGPVLRAAGGEYRARCPAHDDGTPSLYIAVGLSGDRIVVRCNAGCDVEAIVGALGLGLDDLFLDDDATVEVDDDFEMLDGCPSAGPAPAPTSPFAITPGVPADGGPAGPAGADLRDEVYAALLDHLTLSDRHRGTSAGGASPTTRSSGAATAAWSGSR